MTPSRLQVPPRPGPSGSVAIVRETPEPTSTADRRPSKTAAISFPSGEKKEPPGRSVPGRSRASRLASGRMRMPFCDEYAWLKATRRPSGDSTTPGRIASRASNEKWTIPGPGRSGTLSPRGNSAAAPRPSASSHGTACRSRCPRVKAVVAEDCASANRPGRRRTRASPMSRRRSFGSRSRQRSSRRRTRTRGLGRQCRPLRLAGQDRGEHVAHRFAVEELAAGQHLEEHDAEGPDVGAPIDRLAARLLRRHVGGGAEDQAGRGAGVGERRRLRQVGRRSARALATPWRGRSRAP